MMDHFVTGALMTVINDSRLYEIMDAEAQFLYSHPGYCLSPGNADLMFATIFNLGGSFRSPESFEEAYESLKAQGALETWPIS